MTTPKKSAVRIGIGGPVGAGKTSLTAALAKQLKDRYSLAVITNDIYTKEDAEALMRMQILPLDRINLAAVAELQKRHPCLDIILIESGGDNLSATFSPELADITVFVIDVAMGEEIPRKGGPAIKKSDVLVINNIFLCRSAQQ